MFCFEYVCAGFDHPMLVTIKNQHGNVLNIDSRIDQMRMSVYV